MSTEDPRGDWGEWTPGKGVERIRTEMPGVMPDLTEEDYAAADAIIGAAQGPSINSELMVPEPGYWKRRFEEEAVRGDALLQQLLTARKEVKALRLLLEQAEQYARDLQDGQPPTEGLRREWGVKVDPSRWPDIYDDEATARRYEWGDRRVVSRLVGPWEPAEQPEDDPLWAAEQAKRAKLAPLADFVVRTADEPRTRPRMTDGCGPEHTYREGCELWSEGGAQ